MLLNLQSGRAIGIFVDKLSQLPTIHQDLVFVSHEMQFHTCGDPLKTYTVTVTLCMHVQLLKCWIAMLLPELAVWFNTVGMRGRGGGRRCEVCTTLFSFSLLCGPTRPCRTLCFYCPVVLREFNPPLVQAYHINRAPTLRFAFYCIKYICMYYVGEEGRPTNKIFCGRCKLGIILCSILFSLATGM